MRRLTAIVGALVLMAPAISASAQTAGQLCAVAEQQGNEAFLKAHCASARRGEGAGDSALGRRQAAREADSRGTAAINSGNFVGAMTWYRNAANHGNADAELRVGLLYQTGQGVTQDYTQAMAWFQKAAAQGNADAQDHIGILYWAGLRVPADFSQSMAWFQKSAAQRNADAQEHIGMQFDSALGVEAMKVVHPGRG